MNALRLAGVFLLWLGCRAQRVWWMPAGAAIILLGWWLAWQRGAPAPASQRS